jgi:hypothetical protein
MELMLAGAFRIPLQQRHSECWTSCFPKLSSRAYEAIMDARVLDYIDDRLATSSDFEALDSLIENVKEQQDLLKRQVFNTQSASGEFVHVANEV